MSSIRPTRLMKEEKVTLCNGKEQHYTLFQFQNEPDEIHIDWGRGNTIIKGEDDYETIELFHKALRQRNDDIRRTSPLKELVSQYKTLGLIPEFKINGYGLLALGNLEEETYFDCLRKVTNIAFTKMKRYRYKCPSSNKYMTTSDYFVVQELKGLGIPVKEIMSTKNRPYKESLIRSYTIPKSNGKVRIVREAVGHLETLHETITTFLNETYEREIPKNMYAYRKGIGVSHLANLLYEHMEPQDSILKLDIRNWFDTITEKEIYETVFKPCILPHKNAKDDLIDFARALSEVCTFRGRAVQGFKCTPIISLLVCKSTWGRVVNEWLKKYGLVGGIYCDNIFAVIPKEKHKEAFSWLNELSEAITVFSGRKCHKGAVIPWYRKQQVLGLVINKKGQIKHSRVDMKRREMCKRLTYNLEHHGIKKVICKWFLRYQGREMWAIPDSPRYTRYKEKLNIQSKEDLVELIKKGNIYAWIYAKLRFKQWFMGQLNWVGMTQPDFADSLKQRVAKIFKP